MAKQIWIPAIVIPAVITIVSTVFFLGIAVFLDFFYDYSLWLGTLLFIVISAAAWFFAQKSEEEFAQQNQGAGKAHH